MKTLTQCGPSLLQTHPYERLTHVRLQIVCIVLIRSENGMIPHVRGTHTVVNEELVFNTVGNVDDDFLRSHGGRSLDREKMPP